jgi:hypothetical protein
MTPGFRTSRDRFVCTACGKRDADIRPHFQPVKMGTGLMTWSAGFDDPIPLPDGRELVTLEDAADYIMLLSKAEQKLEEWQTAADILIKAAAGKTDRNAWWRPDHLWLARVGFSSTRTDIPISRARFPDARAHRRAAGAQSECLSACSILIAKTRFGKEEAEAGRIVSKPEFNGSRLFATYIRVMPTCGMFLPIDFGPSFPRAGAVSFLDRRPLWQGSCDSFPTSTGLVLIAASPNHFGACNEIPASF